MILEGLVRFSLHYFWLFLLVHLMYWETLRISDIDIEQLRNQQHFSHNHNEHSRVL